MVNEETFSGCKHSYGKKMQKIWKRKRRKICIESKRIYTKKDRLEEKKNSGEKSREQRIDHGTEKKKKSRMQ